jgi:hypothetical protein
VLYATLSASFGFFETIYVGVLETRIISLAQSLTLPELNLTAVLKKNKKRQWDIKFRSTRKEAI